MDKTRPTKKHKHHLLVSEESKREKVKRLSIVAEMGFDSAEENPRKFKLPKKIFGDSFNTVDPASVPRKLRSAIKKRSCEPAAVSLPYPKSLSRLGNGVEPIRKDCLKKLKLSTNSCSDHSPRGAALAPMTKEEEEVAETLSALAGLIPSNRILMNDNMDCKSFETKKSGSAEMHQDAVPAPKEELNVDCHPASEETNVTPMPDGSAKDSMQEKSPTDLANLSWPKLSERRQLNLNLQVSVPPVHLTMPPLLQTCEMKQENDLLSGSEPHIRFGAVDVATSHERQHGNSIEKSDNGLTSRALHGSGVGLSLRPSAVMFPSRLSTATSSSGLGTCEVIASTDKVSCFNGSGKSWKKCAAHVYICRLIQVFQMSEGKDVLPSDASQLRPSLCVAGPLDPPEHSNAAKTETNGMPTSSHMYTSASFRHADEAAHCMPVNHRLHQEQEGPSVSGCCGSKKQSFDFLSLSTRTVSTADMMAGKSFERGAKSHVDFLHSVSQNGTLVSFSLQQNHLPPNSYHDQVAVASGSQVHLSMPPYFGNPFGPPHMGSTTKTALQPPPKLQQQHQQPQIWTAPLTAHFRPGSLLSSDIANWPNRRSNLQSATHHMPPLLPSSSPSLEVFGAKYLHISQQPLLLVGLGPSLPPLRTKPQHNQLPLHL